VITAQQEIDRFLDRRSTVFFDAMMNLGMAHLKGDSLPLARKDMAEVIQRTLILADLAGRRRLLLEADRARSQEIARFADIPETSPIVPGLIFEEAVADMFRREPRLEKSSAEIGRMYSNDRVFAMAHSADLHLTERVQKAIVEYMQKGGFFPDIESRIVKMAEEHLTPFARSYAATVFRTNASTAYTNGRLAQAMDPDVSEIIVGFHYVGIDDTETRRNHRRGFGTMAPTTDPLWSHFRPPNGFQCRCGLNYVSRFEAERLGLWKDGKMIPFYSAPPDSLHRDVGFQGGVF
jgi:SPP1 gp7 family putative phage head morphogenesis protein